MNKVAWRGVAVVLALMVYLLIISLSKAGTPDACEMAAAPHYSACLVDRGWSLELPAHEQQRIEHECAQYVQSEFIRPCRRGK